MSESEKKSKPKETEEERKIRKEKERAERKAKEAAAEAEGGHHHHHGDKKEETEEERKARKKREKEEKRAQEKSAGKREETEEERKARKEKERAERKAKEAAETGGAGTGKKDETEEERKARKEREKKEKKAREKSAEKHEETEEERKQRKERERAERKAREAQLEADNMQSPQKPLPEKSKVSGDDAHSPKSGEKGEKKKEKEKEKETEEERKIRKEKERAARKAKEAAANDSHHNSHVNDESDMLKAIEEENRSALQAAGKASQNGDRSSAAEDSEREQRRREREERKNRKKNRSSSKGREEDSIVDTANLQRQGYRAQFERDLARAMALRRLIDLDDTSAVVVDIGPQTAYDLYLRNFGNSGLSHVSVQAPCQEDMVSEEVQAERVKQKMRSAQVPEDLGLYPEKDAQRSAFRLAGGAAGEDGNDDDDDKNKKSAKEMPSVDIALLSSFLTRVFPVVNTIMNENSGITAAAADKKSKGATSFSSSHVTVCFDGTRNRKVLKTKFGVSNHQQLAALYGAATERGASAELDRFASVVLIWNTRDPTTPEHVLVSLSSVTCIHWSPSRPHLLYGGTEDGCVCVWDLREPDRNHLQAGRYDRLVFRLPSFNSSWHADNHATPVCDVRVAGYNTVVGIRKEEMEQLVSLDTAGQVRFWAVNDKEQATGTISDNDYGLNPFSSVRMYAANLRSWRRNEDGSEENGAAATQGTGALRGLATSLTKRATGLDFSPADASHYLIAMADGVQHISRYGSVAAPAQYGPTSHYFDTPVVVPSCLQCSQLDSRVFVVGYEDGTLRLYLHNQSAPQLTVAVSPGAIVDLRCSRAVKWLTWALDDSGTLHLLDHAHQERKTPFLSQSLTSTETGICTCLDCPSEEKVEQRVLALGFERGVVQIHTLDNEKLKTPAGHRDEGWL